MSKRSEEAAIQAYPVHIIEHQKVMGGVIKIDTNTNPRFFFTEGYEQAEKEFAEAIKTAEDHAYFAGSESMREKVISLIESRISEILGDAQPAPILRAELNELIDKIKK